MEDPIAGAYHNDIEIVAGALLEECARLYALPWETAATESRTLRMNRPGSLT